MNYSTIATNMLNNLKPNATAAQRNEVMQIATMCEAADANGSEAHTRAMAWITESIESIATVEPCQLGANLTSGVVAHIEAVLNITLPKSRNEVIELLNNVSPKEANELIKPIRYNGTKMPVVRIKANVRKVRAITTQERAKFGI